MTTAERAFWDAARRRMALEQPIIAAALLRGFRIIRDSLGEGELARLIATQGPEAVVRAMLSDVQLQRAFLPLQIALGQVSGGGFDAAIRFLPKQGKVDGEVAIAFDVLNPNVVTGIRQLNSRMINTLGEDIRETVRALVENGLRDGVGPRTLAKDLRQSIGLAPNQEEAVRNYRAALEGRGGSPMDYRLRNKRFDTMEMTPERIDRAVDAYRKKFVAWNAETNARTATTDAFKLGQKLAWKDAQAQGLISGPVQKTWIGVMDARERPEHVAMQGETVGIDDTFSNGEDIPGESTFNCRCIARYTLAKAA